MTNTDPSSSSGQGQRERPWIRNENLPTQRKPKWLSAPLPGGAGYARLKGLMKEHKLHTVCEEAHCPNQGECWSAGVATLMILGDTCTRSCGFCNVKTGRPGTYDREEPLRVAESVALMGLKYLTLTSVDRDDLDDLGAEVWCETIRRVKAAVPGIKVEVLVPDFQGRTEFVDLILAAGPDVFNHNFETVRRLQKDVRRMANWEHSARVLRYAKEQGAVTKTGLMLGLGENPEEVYAFIDEMIDLSINILTFGQYLQPTPRHLAVQRWVEPREFRDLADYAISKGVPACESGPLVRSSWHAVEKGTVALRIEN